MEDFICVNKRILSDERLKAPQGYFLIQLIRLANRDGIVNLSIVKIMEELKMTNKAQIIRYLKELISYGYIEKLESEDRTASYKLNREIFYK